VKFVDKPFDLPYNGDNENRKRVVNKMSKIAIMTDSNSGITQKKAAELGVSVLPMPFIIDGKEHYEGMDLTIKRFYEMQVGGADIVTSQPSQASVMEMWDELLKEHDEVVHIPMTAALSESCNTAKLLARDYEGKVHVVDNARISVSLRQSVLDAIELNKRGKSAVEIKKILEADKFNASIYFMVDNMKYLKKGGRITPAAAMIGSVLNIKPVLTFQGGKIDRFAKPRGVAVAKAAIMDAIKKDIKTRFPNSAKPSKMNLVLIYSGGKSAIEVFQKEVEAAFPGFAMHTDPVSLSVATHTGPGIIALGCIPKMEYDNV